MRVYVGLTVVGAILLMLGVITILVGHAMRLRSPHGWQDAIAVGEVAAGCGLGCGLALLVVMATTRPGRARGTNRRRHAVRDADRDGTDRQSRPRRDVYAWDDGVEETGWRNESADEWLSPLRPSSPLRPAEPGSRSRQDPVVEFSPVLDYADDGWRPEGVAWACADDSRPAEPPRGRRSGGLPADYPAGPRPGPATGPQHGYRTGPQPGYPTGPQPGFATGPASGYPAGPQPGYGAGPASEYGTGPQPGYPTGPASGHGMSPQTRYRSAPQPGDRTGPQPGYWTGPQPGYRGSPGSGGTFPRSGPTAAPGYPRPAYGNRSQPGAAASPGPAYPPGDQRSQAAGVQPGDAADGRPEQPSLWSPLLANPPAEQRPVAAAGRLPEPRPGYEAGPRRASTFGSGDQATGMPADDTTPLPVILPAAPRPAPGTDPASAPAAEPGATPSAGANRKPGAGAHRRPSADHQVAGADPAPATARAPVQGHPPAPVSPPAQAKLDQIKDLYVTAEAIGEDALVKHFEEVSRRQRELIREYFEQSGFGPKDTTKTLGADQVSDEAQLPG